MQWVLHHAGEHRESVGDELAQAPSPPEPRDQLGSHAIEVLVGGDVEWDLSEFMDESGRNNIVNNFTEGPHMNPYPEHNRCVRAKAPKCLSFDSYKQFLPGVRRKVDWGLASHCWQPAIRLTNERPVQSIGQ